MPELPEVEVLVRHLAPLVAGQRVRGVEVRRPKVIAPTGEDELRARLTGARFAGLERRGKYLVFTLRQSPGREVFPLVGHLGMTGRMYLQPAKTPLPKHAAVILDLGARHFVYEDTRYFGRLTLDHAALDGLGPEPLHEDFTVDHFHTALRRSAQPVKVKLLDQSLVAGVGNIYASEALHRAGVSPRRAARKLTRAQAERLHASVREVLTEAIQFGSTIPLDWAGTGKRDGMFYYGQPPESSDYYTERLRVYDRAGQPCGTCGAKIRRLVQAARSTFYCPACQPR